MKNISLFSFTIALLGMNLSTFSMFHKTTTIKNKHLRTYLVTSPQYDPEGRRKAYQKWCTTRIKWNDTNKTSQISHKSNNKIIENKMAYYEQFRKK